MSVYRKFISFISSIPHEKRVRESDINLMNLSLYDTDSTYMISSKCFEALMIYPHTFLDEQNHNNTRWMFWKNVENKKLKNLKGNKTFSGTNCILINKENVLIGHEGIS